MKKSTLVFMAMLCVATTLFVGCKDKNDPEPPLPPTPAPTYTDSRDGEIYKIVTIGTQTWMAENLNYHGADLPAGSDTCYENSSSNCSTYGALYTWEGANAAAPPGWHLPSDAEWKTLEMSLGMTQVEADKNEEWRGTDEGTKIKVGGSSGFNLQLAGDYQPGCTCFTGQDFGSYWTSTTGTTGKAYERLVTSMTLSSSIEPTEIYRGQGNVGNMFSIRLIKD